MAASRDATQDQSIEYPLLGGLNQRASNAALPPPDFDLVHGLYMAEAGSLKRLPGVTTINHANEAAVLQIAQMNDGTGSIVVQYDDGSEKLFTLAEIFGRAGDTSDLTLEPGEEIIGTTEDSFPQALIVHEEAQGTHGGAIGSALNTWYNWKLTGNPVNESTIVSTFNNSAASPNPNTFILQSGTYRVEAYCTVNVNYSVLNSDLRVCTISVATPAEVTSKAHGLSADDAFVFILFSGASMPSPVAASTLYYVLGAGITANTFRFSATLGGAAVNTTAAGNGTILLRTQPKDAGVVAVLYNESDAAVLGVFQNAALQDVNQSYGGNPNFPQSRQNNLAMQTAFALSGSAFVSLKVAASSSSGSAWSAAAYARGRSHGVTTSLGGAAVVNRYAAIKITKENA